ncbi:hypothetical protein GCM10028791_09170 [Echinicola sediminis]
MVLEIKRKLEDRVFKNRAFLPFSNVDYLVSRGRLEEVFSPCDKKAIENASRFLYNIKRYNLSPATLIVYRREAYHGKFDSDVRITFDKDIRQKSSPKLSKLYSDFGLSPIWPGYFILEVKYFGDKMPSWARSIIEEFGLRHEALSKYTRGVESSISNF